MKISVILVSLNRKEYLAKTIRYCLAQTLMPLEIIIVDASEREHRQIEEVVSNTRIKYIEWPEIGNISRQRNEGIKRASGDIILFLDDDVKFASTLFDTIIRRFNELKADALTGIIESSHRKISKEVFVFKDDPMLYLGQPSFHQNDFLVQTYLVSAACFAVKRVALLNIGGFDERLNGTFDDSDVGIRLTESGYLVYHDNQFSVYHFAAKGSGSRSVKLGPDWKYTNICYLQLKHFYPDENLFYKKCLKYFIKPSRKWIRPFKLISDFHFFNKGFDEAKKRILKGPIYINNDTVK